MDAKMVAEVKSITSINLSNLEEVVEPPNRYVQVTFSWSDAHYISFDFRPNIFLNAVDSKNSVDTLCFLVEEMKSKNTETLKTIVFCNTIAQCTKIAKYFWLTVGGSIKATESEQNLFCVFDGVSDEKSRDGILTEFGSASSRIRIVIATVAFGNAKSTHQFRFPQLLICFYRFRYQHS